MRDDERGLHRKYEVTRTDGSSAVGGKHADCAYFVLDLEHDTFAIPALAAYAKACRKEYPALAADIGRIVAAAKDREAARCHCREVGCAHSLSQAFALGASDRANKLMTENDALTGKDAIK